MLDHPIHLSSHVGAGSVFGITLPVTPEPALSEPALIPSVPLWSHLDGCVVLCVDNEPAILDGMRSLLENWRCQVLQASDTTHALAAMSEAGVAPDLILVDYHLATQTGIDCIGAIRAKVGHDVPAIVITADRSPGVEEEVRVSGLQLLRKPLKPAALRALMTTLHTRRAAAE
jgi:CheY-like chemotaxis protein